MNHCISTIQTFRQQFFPQITNEQWNSWKWQLQNRPKTPEKLQQYLELTPSELTAFGGHQERLPLGITPYYLALITQSSLRKTMIPQEGELLISPEERIDPLCEEKDSPLPNLVHRYSDRVLFLTTQNCAVYCRYCTRARLVGQGEHRVSRSDWQQNLDYIHQHSEIREVILSGGDALFLDDGSLEFLLQELRKIPHVQIIRLGSKIPVVLPQRVTEDLVQMLRKYHPVYLSLHVLHPDELNEVSKVAISRLVDAGVVIASQTVFLKGVNDRFEIIRELMEKLLFFRIRPYALYQCDLIHGSRHFRTSIQQGIEIIEKLRLHSSGYAVPHYIADPPGGKVTLSPQTIISRDEQGYHLKNWEGKPVFYPDPI